MTSLTKSTTSTSTRNWSENAVSVVFQEFEYPGVYPEPIRSLSPPVCLSLARSLSLLLSRSFRSRSHVCTFVCLSVRVYAHTYAHTHA